MARVSLKQLERQTSLIASLSNDANAVREQLAAATTPEERNALQTQLNSLTTKSAQAEVDAKNAQNELASLRRSSEVSAALSESLRRERDSLQKSVEDLKNQLDAITQERDSLKRRVSTDAGGDGGAKRGSFEPAAIGTLPAQPLSAPFYVGQANLLALYHGGFAGEITIYVGRITATGTQVVVMPTKVSNDFQNAQAAAAKRGRVPQPQTNFSDFIAGRCLADKILTEDDKILRFSYGGTSYALRATSFKTGESSYVGFVISENKGPSDQNLCRSAASANQSAPAAKR